MWVVGVKKEGAEFNLCLGLQVRKGCSLMEQIFSLQKVPFVTPAGRIKRHPTETLERHCPSEKTRLC